MAKQPVTIDFDPDLLEALRAEEPGKPDRELLEDLAHRKLGMSAVRRIRSRFNLPEDEAIALGVRAVHDARREVLANAPEFVKGMAAADRELARGETTSLAEARRLLDADDR
jgi:hypothetical protein